MTPDSASLLDRFLPEYDFADRHSLGIRAPAEVVDAAMLDLDLSSSFIARALYALRGMPADALRLSGLERIGFRRLAHTPGQELVLGLIGRFWTARGNLVRVAPEEFTAFARPGYAKAVWNFRIDPIDDDHTLLSTETRVHCADPVSRVWFGRYWRIIRPFSGLIRREALRSIRRNAEDVGTS